MTLTRKSDTPEAAIRASIVLRNLAAQRDTLEDQIHRQVLAVLDDGGSWNAVALALGTSKQAAWERYRRVPAKYQTTTTTQTE